MPTFPVRSITVVTLLRIGQSLAELASQLAKKVAFGTGKIKKGKEN